MRLIIDTDPGVDDGVALTMALRTAGVRVEAITVVQGNAGLEHNVRNARTVAETCAADVPVYAGARAPISRPSPERPAWIHGADGFGDLGLRPRRGEADDGFAPDQIVRRLLAAPGEITLVAIGPLTNLALALAQEPGIATAAQELVIMGGTAFAVGNATPAAEFNIFADPEAARIVFGAGFALTMVGIEVCRGAARVTEAERDAICASATPAAALVRALLGHSLAVSARRPMPEGERGASCPDGVAMAVALDRSVMTRYIDAFVDVETHGEITTGMTVIDRLNVSGRSATCRVAEAVDTARWKALLRAAVT